MGVEDEIKAVRANIAVHGPGFFVYLFSKNPAVQDRFPAYKGKSLDALKGDATFKKHTAAVVLKVLEVTESAGDAGKLSANAASLVAMPQHKVVSAADFNLVFDNLIGYLDETLGSYARDCWKSGLSAVAQAYGKAK